MSGARSFVEVLRPFFMTQTGVTSVLIGVSRRFAGGRIRAALPCTAEDGTLTSLRQLLTRTPQLHAFAAADCGARSAYVLGGLYVARLMKCPHDNNFFAEIVLWVAVLTIPGEVL